MNKNNFIIKFLTAFIFFLLSYTSAFANWPDQGGLYGGYHMMNAGMGWMMILFWGMVLGILILVIRWVTNLSKEEKHFSGTKKTAMGILKERFAKGEIDIAEYESRKQIISD